MRSVHIQCMLFRSLSFRTACGRQEGNVMYLNIANCFILYYLSKFNDSIYQPLSCNGNGIYIPFPFPPVPDFPSPFPFLAPATQANKDQTSTPGTPCPTLCDKCVGSLTSHRVTNIEVLWDGTYGLSSLSKKTRKSNRLQMSLQRQHFLLSYLKTLSVGPAGVRTHDLPHGSPVLNHLSQPVVELVFLGTSKPIKIAQSQCVQF